jgi:threonine aldolase
MNVKRGFYMIDLRSDTVTTPTPQMRKAMAEAEVGDDVYRDDPTTNRLEELAAKTLGKEAALFVPSGTMGNQLSIMTHTRRGDELITHPSYHSILHEAGAVAMISGVNVRSIFSEDSVIYPDDILKNIRSDDVHCPRTSLLCLENALSNGRVVPLSVMREDYKIAKENGLNVHLDGARIFNAATALNVGVGEIAACADSVQFCLSKGLCAPVGSVICGTREFIEKARRGRKALGGGMRQTGVLAACGIISINEMTKRLGEDHANAKYLADRLSEFDFIEIDPSKVEINMVFFKASFDAQKFYDYMKKNDVKINLPDEGIYRFVTHYYIGKNDVEKIAELIKNFVTN